MPCHQKLTVPFPSSALDPTWCPTGSTHGLMLRPPCFIPRTSCTIQPTWTVDRDKCLHHTDDGHDAATELRWSKECSRFWDRQRSAMYELACGLRGEWTKNVELFLANHSLENEACWEITTWIDMARTFTCSPTWTIFSSKSHHSFDKSNTGSARFTRFLGKKTSISRWETLPPQPQPKWNWFQTPEAQARCQGFRFSPGKCTILGVPWLLAEVSKWKIPQSFFCAFDGGVKT